MAWSELAKQIARELERDCRLTTDELATMLGTDAAEVAATIDELAKGGVIVRYSAKIDWQRLDETDKVYAMIEVSVTPERGHGFDKIAGQIARFDEVHSLYLLSGGYDFMVVLEGNSMRDIAFFVAERLAVIPGVRSTCTHFLLRTYKLDGDILIDRPTDRRLEVSP